MATQLIYTSAPRLLEAGRTGFGTVARHRAVGGLLVAAVERVSQFGRAPGQNPRRVVLSHRIIHAGAGSYHVFSCIRDAGSDYTGRTNHLAHHLIADGREARAAAEAGLTPADILRQMHWRSAWTEAPRFFEPSEEVALTRFRPAAATGAAWQRLTGNAAHAQLAAQSQRCLLLLQGEEGALELFSESLALLDGLPAWLVTFSTHAEPGEDLADLRWLALPADSPLRAQVESASRTMLDLTAPARLPAPRLAEARPGSPPAAHGPAPLAAIPASRLEERPAATPLPPLFPDPPARLRTSPTPYVIAAVITAVIGISSFFLLPRLPKLWVENVGFLDNAGLAKSPMEIAQEIEETWHAHRLKLPETKSWLKAEADEALLDAHRGTLEQIIAAVREPLRPAEISLPPRAQGDFTDLVTHFRAWQRAVQEGVRDPQWSGDDPNEVLAAAQVALSRMKEAWGKVASDFQGVPEMPDVLMAEIHAQVLKHLSGSTAPRLGTPRQWQELLSLTRAPGSPEPAWPQCWETAAKPAVQFTAASREKLGEVAGLPDTPPWLRVLIRQQLQASAQAESAPPAAARKAEAAPAVTAQPMQPADDIASLHPRHIVIESPLLPLPEAIELLPLLPLQPDMQVFIGSVEQAESALTRLRQLGAPGVYRRSFNDPLTLEFHQRRLAKIPDPQAATRILARPADGPRALFEIILLPKGGPLVDAWPSSMTPTFRSESQGGQTFLDPAASGWLGTLVIPGSPPLRLQDVEDPSRRYRLRAEGRRVRVEPDLADTSDSTSRSRLATIDQELESLRQSIRIDEQRRGGLETSNLARAQKEEQARRLDESLAARQQRLLQLEEDRKALVSGTAPSSGLPAGTYSLFAGQRRLCEVRLEAMK